MLEDLPLRRRVGDVRLGVDAEEFVRRCRAESVVRPQTAGLLGGDLRELTLVRVERAEGLRGAPSAEGERLIGAAEPERRGSEWGRSTGVPPGADRVGEIEPELRVSGRPAFLVRQVLEKDAAILGTSEAGVRPRDVPREVRFEVVVTGPCTDAAFRSEAPPSTRQCRTGA